jgi:hypothetical protein
VDGKSRDLGSKEPPPSIVAIALDLVRKHRRLQKLQLPARGKGATELHRAASAGKEAKPHSTATGEDARLHKRPHRPCRRLLNVARKPPTRSYTMYTPGSGDSPTSCRQSGRRRQGIDVIAWRRGGSRRGFRNRLYVL